MIIHTSYITDIYNYDTAARAEQPPEMFLKTPVLEFVFY